MVCLIKIQENILVIVACLLALSGFVFSFSVALTNVFLGLALALGLVSGLWWKGVEFCWENHKNLTIALGLYLMVLVLGLLWSLDFKWGLHVVARHWLWLLVPIVVVVTSEVKWRNIFLASLSLGLTLNLGYCVLQMFGYVVSHTDGSSALDATGHIGHIGFGFVYGIWATWLFYLGCRWIGWQRLVCLGLSLWSYVMIFMADGRAGQLVAIVLLLFILFRVLKGKLNIMRSIFIIFIMGALGFTGLFLAGSERWRGVVQGGEKYALADPAQNNGMFSTSTGQRIYMLKVSYEIWKQHPFLGVGTGGLPEAVKLWHKNTGDTLSMLFVHPHNQYILVLVRWGLGGVLCLLVLLTVWIRQGWRLNWQDSIAAPFMFLTSVSLAVDSVFGPSLEEHFSALFAMLLLGVALSGSSQKKIDNASPNNS